MNDVLTVLFPMNEWNLAIFKEKQNFKFSPHKNYASTDVPIVGTDKRPLDFMTELLPDFSINNWM